MTEKLEVIRRLGAPQHQIPETIMRGDEAVPLIAGGADGIFYVDTRQPFITADQTQVTLTTTNKCLWATGASSPTILPANYWTVGKTLRLTANLKWTNGTAGNTTVGLMYGAADAGGTARVASLSKAKIASVGPFDVVAQAYITCRSIGTAGTLSMFGFYMFPVDLVLSTVQTIWTIPSAGTTVVGTVDTTVGTNSLCFEALTSAGADTVTATNIVLEAMN